MLLPVTNESFMISHQGMAIDSISNFSKYTGVLYGHTALPFFSELIMTLISSVVTGEIKNDWFFVNKCKTSESARLFATFNPVYTLKS